MLVFDTFEDSEFHKEASSGLDSLEGWSLPSMVFHELVWFFKSQGIEIRRTIKKVDEYLTNQKANFVPTTADDVRFATSRMKSNGDYNDLVILSAARRLDLPLFSFDHDLREIAERNSVKTLRRVGANPST